MRVLLLLFVVSATAGCDEVFSVDRVGPPPPPPPPDAAPVCANPIGHDEDGDMLDDACDPCPFDADNDGDDDRDGIALACDPDPSIANEVLLFHGFQPQGRTQFEPTDGGFDVESYRPPSNGIGAVLWGTTVDAVHVVAAVKVEALRATQYREVGIIFDAKVTTASVDPDGTYCVLGRNYTTDYVQTFARRREQGLGDLVLNTTNNPPNSLTRFDGRIYATYTRNGAPQVSCRFSQLGVESPISGSRMTLPEPGKLGLFGLDVDASFAFVFVVT